MKAAPSHHSSYIKRIVQIHRRGTKRRMRFLWPADFSRLGEAKIDKISYVQRIVEKKMKKKEMLSVSEYMMEEGDCLI